MIGRVQERQTLLSAVKNRDSLLLLGPGGSGKTALVQGLPQTEGWEDARLYISNFESPHDLLVQIARGLLRSRHGTFCSRAKAGPDHEGWLSRQTSMHLKGLLWTALETEPRTLIVDGVNRAGHQAYRFLQHLYFVRGMAMIATARDHLHLGELGRLFWDPRTTLRLPPLSDDEALRLFETAADHFELRHLMLDEFRRKVLDSAEGNPGQIVEMCRLASNPQYVTGNYIKFALVRIDVMMKYLG